MRKKVFAIILTLCMVLTMMPAVAWAAVEQPVSIQLKTEDPIIFMDNDRGEWRTDQNSNKYFCYFNIWENIFKEGTILTVTYQNGLTKDYTYNVENWLFENQDGTTISMDDGLSIHTYQDNEQGHWEVGGTYPVEIDYNGIKTTVQVKIVENPVESVSLNVSQPIEFMDNELGEWIINQNDNFFFYYNVWEKILKEGMELTMNYSDSNVPSQTYIYDAENCCFKNENDSISIFDGDLKAYDNQWENHWEVGGTYPVEVEYRGRLATFEVKVIENPVQSIRLDITQPIEFMANDLGEWEKEDNGTEYFYYYNIWEKIFKDGTVLTVTSKDEDGDGKPEQKDYTYNPETWRFENGDDFISYENGMQIYDNQAQIHWDVDGTYDVEVVYNGIKTIVQVHVAPNPVQSISLDISQPVPFVENCEGEEITNGNDKFFEYYNIADRIFKEGMELTVKYENGGQKKYTYTFDEDEEWCFKNGDDIIPLFKDGGIDIYDNQYEDHWLLGETHKVEVVYNGRKTPVQVEIVENPVESVSLSVSNSPMTFIENYDGGEGESSQGNSYFVYDTRYKLFRNNAVLTVKYTDGNIKEYTCDFDEDKGWCFKNGDDGIFEDDGYLWVNDQQDENHWFVGGTNYSVELEYMGKKTNIIPAEIVKNPVESISYKLASPISIKENSNYVLDKDEQGNNYKYYCWYERDFIGDTLVVNGKDETKTTYIGKQDPATKEYYFENEQGGRIDLFYDLYLIDDQYNVHWSAGNTYNVIAEYLGAEAQIPVYIEKVDSGSTAGSGGGGGGVPATPSSDPTQSGTTTTTDLSGSTTNKNGETTTTVDKTVAEKLVETAVTNKSEEIVISTLTSNSAAASTKAAEVTLPAETLGAIAEKTDADVVIKTDVAEVKLDNKSAEAIADQAQAAGTTENAETVSILVEKVKEEAQEVSFELKVVTSGGKVISDFNGGSVSVTVNVPKSLSNKKLVCVYIDENGLKHMVDGQLNADGTYTFTTGHFSTYAIMAEEDAEAAIAEQKEAVKEAKFKLRSQIVKTKSGKKAIRITWTNPTNIKFDGVEIYRSTKKNTGYGKKPIFVSKSGKYTNTSVKAGKKYYYKVRGFVTIDGEKVYTDWSYKAYRTVK